MTLEEQRLESIRKILLEHKGPIAAFGKGYFYIETASELGEYMSYLDDKILQTTNRKAIVYSNFEKKYGKISGKITKLDDY